MQNILDRQKGLVSSYYGRLTFIVLLVGLAAYGVLSILMDGADNLFSIQTLWGGVLLLCGAYAFWQYWEFCQKRPYWLLLFVTVFTPFRSWVTGVMGGFGVGVFAILIPMILVFIPGIPIIFQKLPLLFKRIPYCKFMLLLWALVMIYAMVYDNTVYDNYSTQTLSFRTAFAVTFNLVVVLLTGAVFYGSATPKQLFDRFNTLLFWISAVFSVVVIAAYPFHIFTVPVEGMQRTNFIFTVPSQFAFYMSFMMVYLMGMVFYYKQAPSPRFRLQWALPLVIVLLGIAMMTSLLKNAIFATFIASLLILGFTYIKTKTDKAKLLGQIVLGIVLFGIGLAVFQAVTDISVTGMFMDRLDNTSSMGWRFKVWDYLWSDLSPDTWLKGLGLSAASAKMRIMEGFNFTSDGYAYQVLYPHSDYLACFYDYGVTGLLVFLSLIVLLWRKGLEAAKTVLDKPYRALDVAMVALLFCFHAFCATDNLFYVVESPFWIMLTVLFVISDRMKRQWT